MMTRTFAVVCVVVITLGAPWAARAQSGPSARDAEAHALFEAGRMAFSEGHYADAYERFSESHRLSGRADLLYNMARAADRLERDALALEHYRAFLAAVPDTSERAGVEERITILDAAVAAQRAPVVTADEPDPVVVTPPQTPMPVDGPHATPVWEEWWLWTLVGVVLVGTGVGVGVGIATSSSTAQVVPGDVGPGGVVLTLTAPF